MKKLLITAGLLMVASNATADSIQVDRDTFCSMYKSLLASTGLMEAAEMVELDKQLPGYTHTKADTLQTISIAEKRWDKECIGIPEPQEFEGAVLSAFEDSSEEDFNPTKEQAKRLALLAEQWASAMAMGLDRKEINEKILSLQNEIRANSK